MLKIDRNQTESDRYWLKSVQFLQKIKLFRFRAYAFKDYKKVSMTQKILKQTP
jgi:hypothetical protein